MGSACDLEASTSPSSFSLVVFYRKSKEKREIVREKVNRWRSTNRFFAKGPEVSSFVEPD